MAGLAELTAGKAEEVLKKDLGFTVRLVSEARRFESWLHLEIFRLLTQKLSCIEIEKGYPESKERCDFWMQDRRGREHWLELKVCAANYCRSFTGPHPSRNITQKITSVIGDIKKLRRLSAKHFRTVFLIAYPLPAAEEHPEWAKHLKQIKRAAGGAQMSEKFTIPLNKNGESAKIAGYLINI